MRSKWKYGWIKSLCFSKERFKLLLFLHNPLCKEKHLSHWCHTELEETNELIYSHKEECDRKPCYLVAEEGFEPPTQGLWFLCSNQLLVVLLSISSLYFVIITLYPIKLYAKWFHSESKTEDHYETDSNWLHISTLNQFKKFLDAAYH